MECGDDNQFFVEFTVAVDNPASSGFTAFGNGENYGTFPYGEEFYTVGPFNGLIEPVFELIIFDSDNEACSDAIEFVSPGCDGTDCELAFIDIQFSECNADGQFFVTFGLFASNPSAAAFTVVGNGENYGTFEYGQDSYTVGPFAGLNDVSYELAAIDNENEACFAATEFAAVNCEGDPDCALEVLGFELSDCNEEGQFFVNFILEAVNPSAAAFTVFSNGENYGTFEYGEEIYSVGPFDGLENAVYEINIFDTENDGCGTQIVFESANCGSTDECSIEIIEFEVLPCNEDNEFFVTFQIEQANTESETFNITAFGENYGEFAYGEESYLIGPFNAEIDPVFDLTVTDSGNDSCTDTENFVSPGCSGENPCEFSGLEYELDCVDEEFFITLFFSHSGTIGETFNVFGNGTDYGEFAYEVEIGTEQFTLGPLPADATEYEFIVNDGDDDGCTTGYLELGQVNPEDCTTTGDLCHLEVAEFFITECNEAGQFMVNIFLTDDSFGSTFQIFDADGSLGEFEYGAEVYVIGPFDGDNVTEYSFELADTGFDQCITEIVVGTVFCGVPDCFIDNLEVATGECNEEGTYFIILDFVYNDVGGESFTVTHENSILGTFSLADLPVNIQDFAGNDPTETLTICIDEMPDCCASVTFETPQCQEEGVIVWPGDGNFDGVTNNMDILNLGIAFNAEGPARATDAVDWMSQNAFAWEGSFASGLNYVHADSDGNGIINADDAEVVNQNYSLTHGEVVPFEELEATEDSPALFVDMPDAFELQQGEQFTAPVIFGLEELPVESVYGVAFTLRYDPEIIDPTSVSLQYPISWMGFPQTNILTYDNYDPALGIVDVTITKIDQNNVSGWGAVMNFIGIIDNIAGKSEVFIEIIDVNAIMYDETRFAVNTPLEITTITDTDEVRNLQGLELYPNPTSDVLRMKNETGLTVESIRILDLNGQVLRNVKDVQTIDLSDLPEGVYPVQINIANRTIYHKVVKMN